MTLKLANFFLALLGGTGLLSEREYGLNITTRAHRGLATSSTELMINSLNGSSFERLDVPEKQEEWMGIENERIFDSYWTPTEDTINQDAFFNENDAIKLVVPPLRYNFNGNVNGKITKEEDKQKTSQNARKPKSITSLPQISFAGPKKEAKEPFIIEILNNYEVKGPDSYRATNFAQPTLKDNRRHYEVTESYRSDALTTTPTMIKSGYIYEKPNHVTKEGHNILLNTGKKNQTNTLQHVLSKYNIYSNDNLKNYETSRRTQMYFLPVQFNTPKRKYNRQNHLPVDPLIAVLLSNYGVYLPQFYKINSGYKNLYGHLAFNNIHNNNPFGNYKLFSDTDYDYDDSFSN